MPQTRFVLRHAIDTGLSIMIVINKIDRPGADPEKAYNDCLDLMAQIPDGSVDMVLCDLPYGTTACKWDSVIPFEPLWAHYKRITKRNGAIVLTASQPFTWGIISLNCRTRA